MKIFLTIAAIMSLVLMSFSVYGALFEEASASASVTVNSFVDISLTDAGAAGFAFGSDDPGTSNNKEAAQTDGVASVLSAATVTREATSNVDVFIRLKGEDFTTGGDTIAVSNVKYDDDGEHTEGSETNLPVTDMTTTYPGSAYTTLTSASPDLKVWFWLDIPSGQAAGSYTSTFSFDGTTA